MTENILYEMIVDVLRIVETTIKLMPQLNASAVLSCADSMFPSTDLQSIRSSGMKARNTLVPSLPDALCTDLDLR